MSVYADPHVVSVEVLQSQIDTGFIVEGQSARQGYEAAEEGGGLCRTPADGKVESSSLRPSRPKTLDAVEVPIARSRTAHSQPGASVC